ncbi:MAG: DUF1326 domain-containing protein [Planctomycetota bacterium]|nr:DUF1326 domain-containing protein [Planctomycetota bacterium]
MRITLSTLASTLAIVGLLSVQTLHAAQIEGEYIEARTCDVYTGPCFANAEMDLAGKEAVMAWKVDQGSWNSVTLDGLGVVLVVKSEGTLGDDGIFGMKAGKIKSVIVVDNRATTEQRLALIDFVKDSAQDLTTDVIDIQQAPITLENDHISGKSKFSAGKIAKIETRGMKKGDCVCTNEIIYYQPLTEVENFSPAVALKNIYQGDGLNATWKNNGKRGAFIATFRK